MKSIFEILEPEERTLAVFTTHDEWATNLKFNEDGTGHTGDWALRANPNVDTIVIYHRLVDSNYIYKASITGIEGPLSGYNGRHRYRVHFSHCKKKGLTQATWSAFADCGANPVRYINA